MNWIKHIVFFALILLCLHPLVSPGIALILGFLVAFLSLNPIVEKSKRPAKLLIAWSIIGLGATVNIWTIISISGTYFWLTLISIALTVIGGIFLGRLFKVPPVISALIASGTAICGASAIAAVGSSINAKAEQLSIALGVVLILNAVALYLFPFVGHHLLLSGHDFSVWAGLAIHDTSSVVGAALQFDKNFVETATTVKLARAIWIAPLTILFAWYLTPKENRSLKFNLPWFIWGYLIAATLITIFPYFTAYSSYIGLVARKGFIIGLFLTGSVLDPNLLKALKPTSMVLGIVLWVFSSVFSLFCLFYFF